MTTKQNIENALALVREQMEHYQEEMVKARHKINVIESELNGLVETKKRLQNLLGEENDN